ncbi:M56 family metallopeptidase [Nocardia amamiensis]|uniref:M56 family metallopeptidase n=1 Tax=Nocardia TaxID=1817 RepID=UPI0034111FE8
MFSAALLLLSAVMVGIFAPPVLRRLDPAVRDPAAVLAAWLAAVVGVVVAATASAVVILLPGHGASLIPASLVDHRTWRSVAHGASPTVERCIGIVQVAVLLALTIWFVLRVTRATRERMRASDAHIGMLRMVADIDARNPNVLWLDHPDPVAFSLSGHTDVIVATAGVYRLGPAASSAILAHERAHLRGRHHALLLWIQILADTIPALPLFRHAAAAVAELVELTADAAAARECGSEAVRTALLCMALRCTPTVALGMADHSIERRLTRLALRRGNTPGAVRRQMTRAAAASAAASVPFHLTVALLHIAVLV